MAVRVNRDDVIEWVATEPRSLAVVGLSPNPDRPSHRVAQALLGMGYRIFPVNPTCDEVLGLPCYPDLTSVPGPVEVVQVFRRPEHTPPIAQEAAAEKERLGIRVLWLQEGVVHEDAAEIALAAGLNVVMDRCLYKEIVRLGSSS